MRGIKLEAKLVSSTSDKSVVFIRNLSKRKVSEESGCFFLEGERAVSEVPGKPGQIQTLVVSQGFCACEGESEERIREKNELFSTLKKAADRTMLVTDKVFSSLAQTVNPQGIGAVITRPEEPDRTELLKNARHVLILENLQDPGNLGTCIRTADAMGFDAVICTDNCADVYNQKVLRSTVGSLFHLPVLQYKDGIYKLAMELKAAGLRFVCAHPRDGVSSAQEGALAGRIALVIGNEARGLSKAALFLADRLVTIPMPGNSESLNAGIAAAILMYEMSRDTGAQS